MEFNKFLTISFELKYRLRILRNKTFLYTPNSTSLPLALATNKKYTVN